MSAPTPMSPWFVVQRLTEKGTLEFYVSEVFPISPDPDAPVVDAEPKDFSAKPGEAQVFTNLSTAARVARIQDGHIRALTSQEELRTFRK